MNIQKSTQQGFTLIELMIVIAIVGILAAIALPAYQDYTVRAKMSEALAALAESKTSVSEYYATNGYMPEDADAAGINGNPNTDIVGSIKYVSSGSLPIIAAQILHANLPSESADAYFALSGVTDAGQTLRWICKPGDTAGANPMPGKYLPANCRG
jgi:type IV pilus assembly protein PilA